MTTISSFEAKKRDHDKSPFILLSMRILCPIRKFTAFFGDHLIVGRLFKKGTMINRLCRLYLPVIYKIFGNLQRFSVTIKSLAETQKGDHDKSPLSLLTPSNKRSIREILPILTDHCIATRRAHKIHANFSQYSLPLATPVFPVFAQKLGTGLA